MRLLPAPIIIITARAADGVPCGRGRGPFEHGVGGCLTDGPARDAFYAALAAADLGHLRSKPDPIVFHDRRHTFGTLGAAIWPLHDLQGYMGHADIQTTMIYVHHVPKTAAADELSRAVASALAGAVADQATAASKSPATPGSR